MSRPANKLLALTNRGQCWGYVIYRTTYTPLSDARFPGIVELLNAGMKHTLFLEYEYSTVGHEDRPRAPFDSIWAHHRQVIMDDRALFEGKSFDSLRLHFNGWVREQGKSPGALPGYALFLVVDEESLQSLSTAPSVHQVGQNAFDFLRRHKWWVKAVEACPDEEELDQDFHGWMKCSIFDQWTLWGDMDDNSPMSEVSGMRDKDSGVFSI